MRGLRHVGDGLIDGTGVLGFGQPTVGGHAGRSGSSRWPGRGTTWTACRSRCWLSVPGSDRFSLVFSPSLLRDRDQARSPPRAIRRARRSGAGRRTAPARTASLSSPCLGSHGLFLHWSLEAAHLACATAAVKDGRPGARRCPATILSIASAALAWPPAAAYSYGSRAVLPRDNRSPSGRRPRAGPGSGGGGEMRTPAWATSTRRAVSSWSRPQGTTTAGTCGRQRLLGDAHAAVTDHAHRALEDGLMGEEAHDSAPGRRAELIRVVRRGGADDRHACRRQRFQRRRAAGARRAGARSSR